MNQAKRGFEIRGTEIGLPTVALETRKSGKQYYYRYARVDGKVVKRYVGSGQQALIAAETDRLKREEREAARAAERREINEVNEALEPLAAFGDAYDVLLQAALMNTGFHYQKGQWRQRNGNGSQKSSQNQTEWTPAEWREMSARFAGRRGSEDDEDVSESSREETMTDVVGQMRANDVNAAPTDPATETAHHKVAATERAGATLAELIELSKKVKEGDLQAQEEIVRILDSDADLAAWIGDLSQRAEAALIEAVSDDVFAFKLARARRADSMRQELLAACSTPLEKMAARKRRRIVAANTSD